MPSQFFSSKSYNCATEESQPPLFPCADANGGRIQVELNGTRTELVLTIQVSVDGTNFESLSHTFITSGISDLLDLVGYTAVRVYPTTVETTNTDLRADVAFLGQWES